MSGYVPGIGTMSVVHCRTHDGRAFRMLTVLDEFTRKCLCIDGERRLNSESVLERLSDLFVRRGAPDHIRSDNGPEFIAERVRDWLRRVEVKTLFIEPGSPWENDYIESFNGKLRDELLNGEILDTLWEAKVLIERWRRDYNSIRPHSSLGYRAPCQKRSCSARLLPLQQASRTAIKTTDSHFSVSGRRLDTAIIVSGHQCSQNLPESKPFRRGFCKGRYSSRLGSLFTQR